MLGRLISSLLRRPRGVAALCAEGSALFAAKRFEDAASAFERALLREPDCIAAHTGLGIALQRVGDARRALPHVLRAADANASSRDLNLLAAQLLLSSGQAGEARGRLERLCGWQKDDAEASYLLGAALRELGDEDAALEHYRRFAERHPSHAGGQEALAVLLRNAGLIDAALEAYARAAQLRPELAAASSAMLFHEQYRLHDRAELLRRHVAWAERFAPALPRSFAGRSADPERPLTVGYVSADFNESSAAPFIEPILAGHDRRTFRVACYSSSRREDGMTARLRRHVPLWRDIAELDDAAARQRIEEDAVDVLVDLNGHTRGGRLAVFGLRAAPVQVTYLGYGATTGVAAMDYRITDACIDPPRVAEAYYVERLVRMPATMWCFAPPQDAPPPGLSPAAQNGAPTFGALNNFSKASDAALDAWARILERLPGSRLLLAGVPLGAARRRVLDACAARGVAPDRILMHPRLNFSAFLDLHRGIDIALDSFPYAGGATTCNALWMGVPVVTLEGEAVLARSGASLLRAIGLEQCIARSADDFVERAAQLAQDAGSLANLRADLRERVAGSSLCDRRGFNAALESCYREMWRDWCRRRSP